MRVLLLHSDDRLFEVQRFGDAWARAGGDPSDLLPLQPATLEAFGDGLEGVAGLLLTGGPDVEPWRYGAVPEDRVALSCKPERDALDLELLRRADAAGLPVLAICYGCQLLAVSRGGTLVQDLPSSGKPGHARREEGLAQIAHEVQIAADSRHLRGLPRILGVNSRHHQGVADAGSLRVTALAPDGVVEAVEGREPDRFVLGVQWHPENIAAEPHVEIFREFRRAVQRCPGC